MFINEKDDRNIESQGADARKQAKALGGHIPTGCTPSLWAPGGPPQPQAQDLL